MQRNKFQQQMRSLFLCPHYFSYKDLKGNDTGASSVRRRVDSTYIYWNWCFSDDCIQLCVVGLRGSTEPPLCCFLRTEVRRYWPTVWNWTLICKATSSVELVYCAAVTMSDCELWMEKVNRNSTDEKKREKKNLPQTQVTLWERGAGSWTS